MYLIINQTKNKTYEHTGDYPLMFIEELLEDNDSIIVISLYSNMVKVPIGYEEYNGIKDWEWKEFHLPIKNIVKHYLAK